MKIKTEFEIVDGEDIMADEDKQYLITAKYDENDNLISLEIISEIERN